MTQTTPILDEIESFLADKGMGASYFGKLAIGNSEVVGRLRLGRPVLTSTETAIRQFMATGITYAQRKAGADLSAEAL